MEEKDMPLEGAFFGNERIRHRGLQLSPSVEVKEEGMLQDIRELNDESLLVEGVMRGLVAYDPETRAELTRGTARRKLDRRNVNRQCA